MVPYIGKLCENECWKILDGKFEFFSFGVLMTTENFDVLPEDAIRFSTKELTSGVYVFYIFIENKKVINVPFVISKR